MVATSRYILEMRAVGIKNLNSRLSEYVRLASQGETVLVTDRDRVVAELTPPRHERSIFLADALLADSVRKGWIRPPTMAFIGAPPSPNGIYSLEKVLSGLETDRSDR